MKKMVVMLAVQSVTNEEIARYWKERQMVVEDHLNSAVKAAARIRARNFSVDNYSLFENSLKEKEEDKSSYENKERRMGIKNWWSESKYAYLNQPCP